jgi:nitroimidazol reductase NimA-like FMN-containing flavoprotein (pyridoxamine 5'-phosphate oxidase superfamily)
MPRPMTEQEREAFLAEPHIGVISVAAGDKQPPLSTPVWYNYEPGGSITFFTGTTGKRPKKVELLEQSGVLTFCAQKESFPYKYATVEGTVIQTDRPPTKDQVFTIVRRYLGEDRAQEFVNMVFSKPNSELVVFTVRPDRWLTSDYSEDAA